MKYSPFFSGITAQFVAPTLMGGAIGAGAARGSSRGSSSGGASALSAPADVAWCLLCHLAPWSPACRCGCDGGTAATVAAVAVGAVVAAGAAGVAGAEERRQVSRASCGVARCLLGEEEVGGVARGGGRGGGGGTYLLLAARSHVTIDRASHSRRSERSPSRATPSRIVHLNCPVSHIQGALRNVFRTGNNRCRKR